MVLVLKNEQIEGLVPMEEEVEVIEEAFRELGEGVAMNAPRARLRVPWKEAETTIWRAASWMTRRSDAQDSSS
ncbi:MAG: hypothetical protein HYY45_01685 [Deltaproteobacteria bacterium]|nr:hypothetical protein [Deltaproteobacteria bacterium]